MVYYYSKCYNMMNRVINDSIESIIYYISFEIKVLKIKIEILSF